MRIAAGRFKGRVLPEARDARPVPGRLKTSLFSVLDPVLAGTRVLDVFAGVGGLGFEALSRGAAHVTFVERDASAARRLGDWARAAHCEAEVTVLARDVLRSALPAGPYDVAFADPPFDLWDGPAAGELLARLAALLAPGGVVVVKAPARRDLALPAGWSLVRRREVGAVAYLIARPPEAPPPA